MLLHGCAIVELSSGGIWKSRTSSFKCYVDHSHTMYSSGNTDVRNWVHLFDSPCIFQHPLLFLISLAYIFLHKKFVSKCYWVCLCTWSGRKVMRLTTLCTNRQCCCLPLHMAGRLTPAVDSVQVWTCYSCYAIVESVWSEVVFVRCVTKMDRQKFEQRCAIKFCVQLGESATVTYEKGLWRTFPIQGTSVQMAQVLFRRPRTSGRRTSCGKTSTSKRTTMWKEWGLLWGQIVDWRWEWSVLS